MSLENPEKERAYDLSKHATPHTFEDVAILLVSAHSAKYDLISLMTAAMEEMDSGDPK